MLYPASQYRAYRNCKTWVPVSVDRVAAFSGCNGYMILAIRDFPKTGGTLFWGPYNKDPTIEGTILGSPIFGNPHIYPPTQRNGALPCTLRTLCSALLNPESRRGLT